MKPGPDKVAAITQMPTPQNKQALLLFIGMVNYLSPFCPNLSSVIQLLRVLTQHTVPSSWSMAQEKTFNKAKRLISSAPAYNDLPKPVVVEPFYNPMMMITITLSCSSTPSNNRTSTGLMFSEWR